MNEQHSQQEKGAAPPSPFNLRQAVKRFERGFVQNVLQLAQGDIEMAAQLLEIPPDLLARKLRQFQECEREATKAQQPRMRVVRAQSQRGP